MSLFETGLFCGHCMNQPCSCDKESPYISIYFDMEFTGLHKYTTPISIGCVSESGATFYAEFIDYEKTQVDDWIKENVLSNLKFNYEEDYSANTKTYCNYNVEMCSTSDNISRELLKWLKMEHIMSGNSSEKIEPKKIMMCSDCLAYDWMLFNDLICKDGQALNLPNFIYYIPMDLSTLMWSVGIDPDINREIFLGSEGRKIQIEWSNNHSNGDDTVIPKHNSLWDAIVIKASFEKIISGMRATIID